MNDKERLNGSTTKAKEDLTEEDRKLIKERAIQAIAILTEAVEKDEPFILTVPKKCCGCGSTVDMIALHIQSINALSMQTQIALIDYLLQRTTAGSIYMLKEMMNTDED